MGELPRLILNDPTDPLGRKVVRCELVDQPLIAIDFPKRYAGDGATQFTDPIGVRYLDKESCVYLVAWLTEVMDQL